MCGLVLLHGPRAAERLPACLQRIAHRGPDAQYHWHSGALSLGFARLAINDKSPAGQQPYRSGSYVAAINGEIYNAAELRERYQLKLASSNDCHVVPAMLDKLGVAALENLDGFFAGVVVDERAQRLLVLRDAMGKKPLFWGRSGSERFITSELKALDRVDDFTALPSGVSEINLENGHCTNLSAMEPECEAKTNLPSPQSPASNSKASALRTLLALAVEKRLPAAGEPVGVFLSGGLDSSAIAALVHHRRPDARYYCLSAPGAADHDHARLLVDHLKLTNVRYLTLPTGNALSQLIHQLVYVAESYNPSVISNGLCTYLLAEAAREDGLKVVLSGEGADELFGGYHHYRNTDPWRETREQLLANLRSTELRRIDLTGMAHAIETRCPFLDRDLYNWALALDYDDLYRRSEDSRNNKIVLREAVKELLPEQIVLRRKTSCDVGSGMRALVVRHLRRNGCTEREALRLIWRHHFLASFDGRNFETHPYFSAYPVFDELIDRRGVDHK
ncbi:asparagine synthase-related protein [Microbulbifer bruguierae]|uniref:asparagine synthase (glutamine-hydrolyzing) n=1 Tax=Microbulbifer bruguierae TaxID=3029061 RepID=A0ABY8N8J0_9GAMM|nr:asparagine synthase-related protein [Microbulbifer bruguierae]WGL15206.1 asparagine synthase-related protein [Microbulbifer bruguierae]